MKFEDMINTIQLGDCYEMIKNIPDKSVDCVYIDIPYLFDSHGKGHSQLAKRMDNKNNDLIDIQDGIDYSILDELYRVMKKVNCFIWCSKHQILEILNYFTKKKCGFEILTWNKTNPSPTTNNIWLPDIEYCLYFREKGVLLNDGYELKSKWYISSINKNDKGLYNHPTIKPLNLVERHIKHTTKERDIVLDCFCGSGTTCVACKELNRRFIGMEINKDYYEIACKRLNGITAYGQTSIFTNFNKLEKSDNNE